MRIRKTCHRLLCDEYVYKAEKRIYKYTTSLQSKFISVIQLQEMTRFNVYVELNYVSL